MTADHPGRGVAVVTGGSAGVGRAVVRRLAEEGFDVAILARGEAGLVGAARDVRARGRRVLTAAVDVADADAVEVAASRVEAELGPIDAWVNNAMTTVFAWSWDVEPEEYRRATEVTYLGQVHGTLAALRRMRPRRSGRVVNVGSALAYVGIPLQAPYCAAKFAARGFSEAVRAELLHEGSPVTVSMVHLPAVDTPQFTWCRARLPNEPRPVAPVYGSEVAARHIVAVVLDGRRAKVLGAWNRLVVAGAKLAPAVVSHYAARTGVAAQQTDRPLDGDRAGNLLEPGDGSRDHGADGTFADSHGGVRNPQFRAALPDALRDVAGAVADAARFRAARRYRVTAIPLPDPTAQARAGAPNGATPAPRLEEGPHAAASME